MKYLAVLIFFMITLSSCAFGVKEDYDQIGSLRKSYTLGWKEPAPWEPYRPARQENNYYQAPPQGAQSDCPPQEAPASPQGWKPWMK